MGTDKCNGFHSAVEERGKRNRVSRMVCRLVSEGGLSGLLIGKSWINDSDGL